MLSTDMKNIMKPQFKLLEMKTIRDGINSGLDFVEERIGEPEDI